METTKICTCCNTEKNLTEFYKRSLNEDRKKYKREHSKRYRQTENGKLSQLNKYHKRRTIFNCKKLLLVQY